MTDIDRLKEWMKQRDLSMTDLAAEMELPYINVNHTLVARPKRNGNERINGNFIVRFIKVYGLEEARAIFAELMETEAV